MDDLDKDTVAKMWDLVYPIIIPGFPAGVVITTSTSTNKDDQ